jgi:hypothetical protein
MAGQDGIRNAPSEAIDVESGIARVRCTFRVELEEFVTQLPFQLATASGHWRQAGRERGTMERLYQRGLAATTPIGDFVQRRPDSQQCAAGCFKGITHALVESGDAARRLELRVEFLELDRRRKLPGAQPLEICHHPVHEFPDGPKSARLLGRSGVMGVPGPPRDPPRLSHASPMDGVGEDDGADQAEQGLKRVGGCGPLLEGLTHVLGHAERLELTHLVRRRSPAAPRPPP